MTEAVLAATVVLLRDAPGGLEVLLLQRPAQARAFAGAWVFPGGKVDPEDFGPGEHDPNDGGASPERELLAARRAGVRETWEETGLRMNVDELAQLSVWIPGPHVPRRFRTLFFVAAAPSPEQPIVLNVGELEDYAWLHPETALARHGAGTMTLAPPTWVTLHWLSHCADTATALGQVRTGQPEVFQSRLREDADGRQFVLWPGDADYDDAGRGADPQARHRLEVTSLPWAYERNLGDWPRYFAAEPPATL
ncbi:NUDIX hydrolase [Arthrobacter crystallopoietes BAB-32]|uniref:NUDIX hydrolase n=1 Tax=Arthrobacter crystallopoietes BAB-32 TaxID=1246476 RepID=N1UTS7_9MICC|nr:NUDIX domain-containing protein [Arthrobacter crystallopoietes]EMY33796.1 NUDIX hydrolase [Arthrobacter crystallopoietes BAB-32]